MTDAPKRKVAKVPDMSVTAVGATALFLGALGGLGTQMALGKDPMLGAKKPATVAAAPARRKVVEHRVIRRVVVTKVVTDAAPATPVASSSGYSAPAASYSAPAASYSAPVVRYSAPAAAPAPAPAPVQTASS